MKCTDLRKSRSVTIERNSDSRAPSLPTAPPICPFGGHVTRSNRLESGQSGLWMLSEGPWMTVSKRVVTDVLWEYYGNDRNTSTLLRRAPHLRKRDIETYATKDAFCDASSVECRSLLLLLALVGLTDFGILAQSALLDYLPH